MSPELISFLIHWLPTLIFLGCFGIAILFGAWRETRKSAILSIQAGIVFVILLIVYFSIAGAPSTDTGLFNLVSSIIGEGQIQSMMGVSKSCQSFKECFIELIPKLMPENEGLALIIADNDAYLATLAEMAVRIVVALALGIIYILAIFILYLVYLIFYPQRRYERNLEKTYYQDIKNKELYDERKAMKEANKKKKVEEAAKAEAIKEAEHELELHETEADESLMAIIDDEENSADFPLDENSEAIDGDKLEEEIEHEEKIEETQVEEEVKEEVEEKEEKKEPHKPFEYKKRRLWRALLGGVRNLISGIIFFSFVGEFFYILAGGPGDDVTPVEMSFGDPTYDLAYGAYSNIVTYGSTGIFKVLNAFKGSDNTPLYLFAAD
jgi:Ca2+/Na+ antiporter